MQSYGWLNCAADFLLLLAHSWPGIAGGQRRASRKGVVLHGWVDSLQCSTSHE